MIPRGVSVTLVEPQYPVNLGHVARLMKNFGVKKLYLVKPKVDFSVAATYASHASDVLDDAELVTLEKVREENELLVATTAVTATRKSNVIRSVVRPERLRPALMASASSSIVFGRDTTGLTKDEIRLCDLTTTITTGTNYRALNLGHAVAVILYLASREDSKKRRSQTRGAREAFVKNFYELAVASGTRLHKVKNAAEVAKRSAAGSNLTDGQLNFMSGIFRKATLAISGPQDADSKT